MNFEEIELVTISARCGGSGASFGGWKQRPGPLWDLRSEQRLEQRMDRRLDRRFECAVGSAVGVVGLSVGSAVVVDTVWRETRC